MSSLVLDFRRRNHKNIKNSHDRKWNSALHATTDEINAVNVSDDNNEDNDNEKGNTIDSDKLVQETLIPSLNTSNSSSSIDIKQMLQWWLPVVVLVIQNSGLILTMRYSRIKMATNGKYLASVAVVCSETLKFITAMLISYKLDSNLNVKSHLSLLKQEMVDKKDDMLKLCIPAVLYMIQNNLQYIATSSLSAPLFQVLYQLKLLSSAFFAVILLNKKLNKQQWGSMMALTVGVAAVQYSQVATSLGSTAFSMIGLISVLCACLTSGLAGAVMELLLKTSKHSVWMRSIQFSFLGIVMSAIACFKDKAIIVAQGSLFSGFTPIVWSVVGLQALGGLTIALVVKNADNLVKGFATSLSILLSCALSHMIFNDLIIHPMLLVGSTTVVGSTYWFGQASTGKNIRFEPKRWASNIRQKTGKMFYDWFLFFEQFDPNPVTPEGKAMREEKLRLEAQAQAEAQAA